MKTKMLVPLFAILATVACGSSSGGSGDGNGNGPADDDTPVTATSAAGLWKMHYDWGGSAPDEWAQAFGAGASGDVDLAIPSDTQKRGMFTAATTDWGFAPIASFVENGEVKWSVVFNGGKITLDFTGTGTGSSVSGTAKFSNDGKTGTWSATKVTAANMTSEKLAGDWTMSFQWSGRTPGELLVKCTTSSCTIPAGQDGGPSKDDVGTVTLDGNRFKLAFPDSTHLGVAVSNDLFWGYMDSAGGNTGVWIAKRGKPSSSSSSSGGGGCTADVDCGHCERCERSTGNCISRLSC